MHCHKLDRRHRHAIHIMVIHIIYPFPVCVNLFRGIFCHFVVRIILHWSASRNLSIKPPVTAVSPSQVSIRCGLRWKCVTNNTLVAQCFSLCKRGWRINVWAAPLNSSLSSRPIKNKLIFWSSDISGASRDEKDEKMEIFRRFFILLQSTYG